MSNSAKIAVGAAVAMLLPMLLVAAAGGTISAILGSSFGTPSRAALADIPADYLALYQQAATECPSLDWSILAAIGKIESDHGRSTLPGIADGTENAYHARGPMQFLQPSFDGIVARHTIPPGGHNPPSPWNKHDAIFAASFYLCEHNASHDLRAAIFAYNHADWYVDQVLAQATQYRQATSNGSLGCGPALSANAPVDKTSSDVALTAVAFACAQIGKPYVWGGNGDPGFDCSGLTKAAYAAASITLPRTAQTQYNAGPLIPRGVSLQPGDLVFFGTSPTNVTHVSIALGGTLMVNAPTFNEKVRVDDFSRSSNLIGATRPTGNLAT